MQILRSKLKKDGKKSFDPTITSDEPYLAWAIFIDGEQATDYKSSPGEAYNELNGKQLQL